MIQARNIADGAVTADKIDFATFKKWVPDYASRDNANLYAATMTMPDDGFLTLDVQAYHGSFTPTLELKINGVQALYLTGPTTNQSGVRVLTVNELLPVAKGDVVTLAWANDEGYNRKFANFTPGRWV